MMDLSRFTAWAGACLVASLLIAGCTGKGADERLRALLFKDRDVQLTEELVEARVAELVPVGTPEPVLAEKVAAIGVGKDPLSSYGVLRDRAGAVVRVEFDPSTFAVTKPMWIISFGLDNSGVVRSVKAKRYVAGP